MGIAAPNKREPVGEALEPLRGTKEFNRKKKKPRRKTKPLRWRRPGTSTWNKRKSVRRQRSLQRTTKRSAGEGLELVHGTKGSSSEDKGNLGTKQNEVS